MDPLAGWTVAVSAEERAREQAALLQRRGATVLLVPAGPGGPARLGEAAAQRGLDAVTFSSPAAARDLAAAGGADLVERLAAAGVACACLDPATARAAEEAGLASVLVAGSATPEALVGLLADHLGRRGREFAVAGHMVRVQGARVDIDGHEVRLTPRERTLLEAIMAAGGAVLSKRTLSQLAWNGTVSEHTVEVTVNRLRSKLGPAAVALETSNRRGYRLRQAG